MTATAGPDLDTPKPNRPFRSHFTSVGSFSVSRIQFFQRFFFKKKKKLLPGLVRYVASSLSCQSEQVKQKPKNLASFSYKYNFPGRLLLLLLLLLLFNG